MSKSYRHGRSGFDVLMATSLETMVCKTIATASNNSSGQPVTVPVREHSYLAKDRTVSPARYDSLLNLTPAFPVLAKEGTTEQ